MLPEFTGQSGGGTSTPRVSGWHGTPLMGSDTAVSEGGGQSQNTWRWMDRGMDGKMMTSAGMQDEMKWDDVVYLSSGWTGCESVHWCGSPHRWSLPLPPHHHPVTPRLSV